MFPWFTEDKMVGSMEGMPFFQKQTHTTPFQADWNDMISHESRAVEQASFPWEVGGMERGRPANILARDYIGIALGII